MCVIGPEGETRLDAKGYVVLKRNRLHEHRFSIGKNMKKMKRSLKRIQSSLDIKDILSLYRLECPNHMDSEVDTNVKQDK